MKARFQIRNVTDTVPALPLSFVFSQLGGTIGAADDANWRIQDVSGTIGDIVARVMVLDGHFTIEPTQGSDIHINGGKAPMTANRAVILSDKDLLQIGDLQCVVSLGLDQSAETQISSIAAFAAANGADDNALLIEGKLSVSSEPDMGFAAASGVDPIEKLARKTDRHRSVDPLQVMAASRKNRKVLSQDDLVQELVVSHSEAMRGTGPDYTQSANASLMARAINRDQYGFEEEGVSRDEGHVSQPHTIDHIDMSPLSRALGVPLGDLDEAGSNQALTDIGGALRAAIDGLVSLYSGHSQNTKIPFSAPRTHALDDNPIRFGTSTDEVLHTLFAKRGRVQQSAPSAIADAVQHLDTHTSATETAIESALDAVLEALMPTALEQRFTSYVQGDIPADGAARDAWCWQMYRTYFSELSSNRQRGLQLLFWEIFQHDYQGAMRKPRTDKNEIGDIV